MTESTARTHRLRDGGHVTVFRLPDAAEITRRYPGAVKALETWDEVLYLARPQVLLIMERRMPRRVSVYEFDASVAGRETCFEVVAAIAQASTIRLAPTDSGDDEGGGGNPPLQPAVELPVRVRKREDKPPIWRLPGNNLKA